MTNKDIDRMALVLARHVDNLQRLANTWSDDFEDKYEETEAMALALLNDLYDKCQQDGALTYPRIKALEEFRRRIAEIREQCYEEMLDEIEDGIEDLAGNESEFHVAWIILLFALAYADRKPPRVVGATKEGMDKVRKYGVYNGETVKRIFQRMRELDVERITSRVSTGIGQRKTIAELTADVKAAFEIAKRQIRMNTAGVVNGVSNDMSAMVAERNKEVVDGVMWITALDERVCDDCAEYEGKVFVNGTEPACPVHVNCRCHLVPVTIEVANELEEMRNEP